MFFNVEKMKNEEKKTAKLLGEYVDETLRTRHVHDMLRISVHLTFTATIRKKKKPSFSGVLHFYSYRVYSLL